MSPSLSLCRTTLLYIDHKTVKNIQVWEDECKCDMSHVGGVAGDIFGLYYLNICYLVWHSEINCVDKSTFADGLENHRSFGVTK